MKILYGVIGTVVFLVAGYYAIAQYMYQAELGQAPTLPALYPAGEHLGFIHGITDSGTVLNFDDAVWLSGIEGENAAIAAGLCTEETREECLPNDFFIANGFIEDKRILINPSVVIVMQTWGMEEIGTVTNREINLSDFATLINNPEAHWRTLPYTISVTNGVISHIEEVYIP